MAAVTELCFLLFALINNIHAEELITIKKERDSYTFHLPKEASSCLISRFVGEEKLVLWNTSDLWSHNSTVPEDLKQRLSVVSRKNISSYIIHNLTHSDSGLYQEECWTDGKVTYERNSSVIICSSVDRMYFRTVPLEESMDLPCYGAADNLDFLWLKRDFRYKQEIWKKVFGENTTSVMDDDGGRYQVEKNSSNLRVFNFTTTIIKGFTCLVMNQQQCVSSQRVRFYPLYETIYGSVGETAVLPCTVTDLSDDQPPRWINFISNTELKNTTNRTVPSVDQNYSLVFSSLTLNHTSLYDCKTSLSLKRYFLLVCPKFGPPAVELFSEGEEITLQCKDLKKGWWHTWFIKSNQTEGRIVTIDTSQTMSRVSIGSDGSLVISNVSLKDTGEYWCAVYQNYQCVSSVKTVLMYRDPFGIHSTFYTVRCSVLSGLLVMLCVVVVAVNQRSRRGEQLSAQTHS
ncbi:uncharacterized protein LOC125888423 isoform X1 [Epinephelus fuscoguttatus]|uniref:uncharacterized protein LOC125888423 isoform X1 n=1 Tax=Epinephelus fuscoguttatus TaxID=293821 RepID=UPI0020D01B39|nr:uncharacterized protein LOC125888423 isoform X1 [Epinephelus fuscoguttatus]XP_049431754.1 uncharacterized protein LOC125888423 isoform X1 [Epinephelus fuscoguttatus]